MLLIDIHIVSSVSARKLKCPSSARLGSEPFQLGSAQLGKFQLELITRVSKLASQSVECNGSALGKKTKKITTSCMGI